MGIKRKVFGRPGTYDGLGKSTKPKKSGLQVQEKPLNACPFKKKGKGRVDANGAIIRNTGADATGGVRKAVKGVHQNMSTKNE